MREVEQRPSQPGFQRREPVVPPSVPGEIVPGAPQIPEDASAIESKPQVKKTKRMLEVEKRHGKPIEELWDEFYSRGKMTTTQLGEMLGITQPAIHGWAKRLGLTARSSRESMQYFWQAVPAERRSRLLANLTSPEAQKRRREKLARKAEEATKAVLGENPKRTLQRMSSVLSDSAIAEKLSSEKQHVTQYWVRYWRRRLGIAAKRSKKPSAHIKKEDRRVVKQASQDDLALLNPRERAVLGVRYGAKPKTLKDTGKTFGVSRERVRQVEGDALRKLKKGNPQLQQQDSI